MTDSTTESTGVEHEKTRPADVRALALVLLLVAVTFSAVVRYRFVEWDDPLYVTRNPAVVGPLAGVDLAERLLTPALGYPIPVVVALFGIEHALFGVSPAGYHAVGLALHLIVCALLFVLSRRLGAGTWAAALGVALFGVHPVVAEPVAWVSGQKDLLSTVCCLAAALAFIGVRPSVAGKPSSASLRLLPTAWFVLGALSKPTALFLVPLLFVWHLLLFREGVRRALVAVLPMGGAAVVVFVVSFLGQRAVHAVRETSGMLEILRDAWYALGFHLGLMVGVQTPCAKHFPLAWPLVFEPAVDLLPWAVGALLASVAITLRRAPAVSRRGVLAGLAWAVLSYLPSSNLIPLTRYLADSYVYLPLAGVALSLASAVTPFAPRRSQLRWVFPAVASALVVLLALAARRSAARFTDDVALWRHAFERYPGDYRLCRNLGNAYVDSGQPSKALELYESCAARLAREPFRKNIAVVLFVLGRREEARAAFLQLFAENPADPVVRKYLSALGEDMRR